MTTKPRSRMEEEARRLNALKREAAHDAPTPTAPAASADGCPRCGQAAVDGGDESSGSSSRWLACNACGFHWRATGR